MTRIKVLIADDQELIREGLQMMLGLYPQLEIVGTAVHGRDAVEKAVRLRPDVVLMDIRMPVLDGVQATRQIKEQCSTVHVIILTTFDEDEYIFEALKYGATGYLLKDVASEEIVKAIETVRAGHTLLEPKIAARVVQVLNHLHRPAAEHPAVPSSPLPPAFHILTGREAEIALRVGEGYSNKEIAEILCITEGTVKNHLTKILSKLALRDRTQLALFVREHLRQG